MTNKIENGEYVKNENSGVFQIDYIEEVLQNVWLAMRCERGGFYPDKNYGSHLKESLLLPKEQYILALARQSAEAIDGVYIKSVDINEDSAVFTVLVNNDERRVSFDI